MVNFRRQYASLLGSLIPVLVLAGCAQEPRNTANPPVYAATIHPVAAILQEIVRDRAEVEALVPPGGSPHAFELRPSDARRAQDASALFFAHSDVDGWATRLDTRETIELYALLRGTGNATEGDPHFWTDPLFVRDGIPALVDALIRLDPEGEQRYRDNAARFIRQLDQLDASIRDGLGDARGQRVVLYHPSWLRFFERYGIEVVAVVERASGQEPTPRRIRDVLETARREDVRVLFIDEQTRRHAAEVLEESSGLDSYVLDPIGGVEGRETYIEWMRYNAERIEDALT